VEFHGGPHNAAGGERGVNAAEPRLRYFRKVVREAYSTGEVIIFLPCPGVGEGTNGILLAAWATSQAAWRAARAAAATEGLLGADITCPGL
jgi:hypothetical protein